MRESDTKGSSKMTDNINSGAEAEASSAQAASTFNEQVDTHDHAEQQSEHSESHSSTVSRRSVLKVAAQVAVAAPFVGLEEAAGQRRRRGSRSTNNTLAAATKSTDKPLFFSPAEFALLDELSELVIPTDDHSPGARAAGVALYIDRRLAETSPAITEYAKERQTWRNGLKLVDQVSQGVNNGKTFMAARGEQRIAALTRMAEDEPRQQPVQGQANPPQRSEQPTQQPSVPGEAYKEGGQNRPEQKAPGSTRKSEGEFFTFLKAQVARAYYTSEIGLQKELEYKGNQYLKEFVGYDRDGKYTDAPKKV